MQKEHAQEVEAEIKHFLGRQFYPISKTMLIKNAQIAGKGDGLVDMIEHLPDKVFRHETDVLNALKKHLPSNA